MQAVFHFLHNYKLVRQSTSPLLKTAVTMAIALCTVALVALRVCMWEKQTELSLIQDQAARISQENAELQARVDALGTAESYRQIAAEQLGLVDPDTIIIESD